MQRQWNIDIIRIVSMAAVVLLHTAAYYWPLTDIHTLDWQIMNIYDGAVRWAVPVFVMISGCLLLDPAREYSLRRLYTKNIFHIVTVFLFWSLIYSLIYSFPRDMSLQALIVFFKTWLWGHFHMWFLFLIVGLYVITPLLRCITKNEAMTNYFLVLGFIFTILIPFISSFDQLSSLSHFTDNFAITLPVGYVFYYVLGFQINSKIKSFDKNKLLVGGICVTVVGIVLTVVLTNWLSLKNGVADLTYYSNTLLPVFLSSIGVFVIGLQIRVKSDRMKKILPTVSQASLGVYMVHIIVLDALANLGINALMFTPALAIPITAFLATICSFVLAVLMVKMPFVGKHFV